MPHKKMDASLKKLLAEAMDELHAVAVKLEPENCGVVHADTRKLMRELSTRAAQIAYEVEDMLDPPPMAEEVEAPMRIVNAGRMNRQWSFCTPPGRKYPRVKLGGLVVTVLDIVTYEAGNGEIKYGQVYGLFGQHVGAPVVVRPLWKRYDMDTSSGLEAIPNLVLTAVSPIKVDVSNIKSVIHGIRFMNSQFTGAYGATLVDYCPDDVMLPGETNLRPIDDTVYLETESDLTSMYSDFIKGLGTLYIFNRPPLTTRGVPEGFELVYTMNVSM
jgi:hypothetical protein